MLLRDAILAWIHFVLIFGLASCLFAELVLYRSAMERAAFSVLRKIDMAFGILAGLIILSGISRVIYSPKGSEYYMHNSYFWTKMALFVTVAILSIPPTVHFIRVWLAQKDSQTIAIDAGVAARIRAFMVSEAVILLTIPLFAALMAG